MLNRRLFVLFILIVASFHAVADMDYKRTKKLLDTNQTIVGETINYLKTPKAEIEAIQIVMEPGEKTAWHQHGAPLFAYIIEGTLTVSYEGHGSKTYNKGDTFMEAMSVTHQGSNTTNENVVILAVFMGGEGYENVIKVDK